MQNEHPRRREALLSLSGLALGLVAAPARAATQTAQAHLDGERTLAAAEGKGVLLVFFASWCSWCRLLDGLLADPVAAATLGSRFRIVHMRVRERRSEMIAQELPGVDDLVVRLGGEREVGLPFYVFLSGDGDVLASSIFRGSNIGFPVTAEELDAFDAIVARAAPDVSAADRARLRRACASRAPR